MANELKLVVDAKAALAEGPCWDDQRNLLYWVDIMGMNLHVYDPHLNANRTYHMGQYVGAAVPSKTGGVVLALQHGFYNFYPDTEELKYIVDPESNLPNNRFNDGKCDPAGRFWAGTMSLDGISKAGALYCLETDYAVKMILKDVTTSNGLAWSPDHRTMYYIDTPTQQVAAYDYDYETATISNKRIVIHFSDVRGNPDGMTIDEEGMLWIAEWGGYQVARWNPHTGEILEVIPIPAAQVTSCAFGGEQLDVLYITTASVGQENEADQPFAGGLFSIKTKVKGLKTYAFGD